MRANTSRWTGDGDDGMPAAGLLLIAAALLVGTAIALDGAVTRALNGAGGVAWVAAAVLLGWSLRRSKGRRHGAAVALGATLLLALAVRPSDLVAATVGFGLAGGLVAAVAAERRIAWALLVPAAWLPIHVLTRVAIALGDDGPTVRTDPPPIAAVVPLAMVLAAGAGGVIVGRWRARRPAVPERAAVESAAD